MRSRLNAISGGDHRRRSRPGRPLLSERASHIVGRVEAAAWRDRRPRLRRQGSCIVKGRRATKQPSPDPRRPPSPSFGRAPAGADVRAGARGSSAMEAAVPGRACRARYSTDVGRGHRTFSTCGDMRLSVDRSGDRCRMSRVALGRCADKDHSLTLTRIRRQPGKQFLASPGDVPRGWRGGRGSAWSWASATSRCASVGPPCRRCLAYGRASGGACSSMKRPLITGLGCRFKAAGPTGFRLGWD